MKLTWCTDIHLDHLANETLAQEFCETIRNSEGEAVILTGDLSSAKFLQHDLNTLERIVQKPIYFVLGNHDYYGSMIKDVRHAMKATTTSSTFLRWLGALPYAKISDKTALVGHDGWYDCLNGSQHSRFVMSDWIVIGDFVNLTHSRSVYDGANDEIKKLAQELAMEGVKHVHAGIKSAASHGFKNIVVATHFPPWKDSHRYKGAIGDDDKQGFYTSKLMGNMLDEAARAFPNISFTVLAGHTHGHFEGMIHKNMVCFVGESEYEKPRISAVLDIK
jgi:predicted phosphohydrolase